MKVTLMGMLNTPPQITEHLTLEEAISFKCLNETENKLLQDNFVRLYYERPILVYNPEYFFKFLRTTCDILENNVRMLKLAYESKFNPLENYDRYEEQSIVSSGKTQTDGRSKTSANASERGHTENIDRSNSSIDTQNKVSAFDTKVLSTHDEQLSNSSDTVSNHSASDSDSITSSEQNANTESSSEGSQQTVSHIHGNIGVTTATQMLNETIDLFSNSNFYNEVCEMICVNSQCFYYYFN